MKRKKEFQHMANNTNIYHLDSLGSRSLSLTTYKPKSHPTIENTILDPASMFHTHEDGYEKKKEFQHMANNTNIYHLDSLGSRSLSLTTYKPKSHPTIENTILDPASMFHTHEDGYEKKKRSSNAWQIYNTNIYHLDSLGSRSLSLTTYKPKSHPTIENTILDS